MGGSPPAARLERLRAVRERLLATPALFPVAIGRSEGEELLSWVQRERARRTLEVGLGWGVGTLFICEGLLENDGTHVACDPFQFASPKYGGAAIRALEEAGVRDLVEFYTEESQNVLPRLLEQDRRFDLAFIDGSHRFERVSFDLGYSNQLVKEGGVVFVDDVQLTAVRAAVDHCVETYGWRIEEENEESAQHHWLIARTGPPPATPAQPRD